jgi:hypothetical protein
MTQIVKAERPSRFGQENAITNDAPPETLSQSLSAEIGDRDHRFDSRFQSRTRIQHSFQID